MPEAIVIYPFDSKLVNGYVGSGRTQQKNTLPPSTDSIAMVKRGAELVHIPVSQRKGSSVSHSKPTRRVPAPKCQ